MKQLTIAAATLAVGFAGAALADEPTEDPIKGGQGITSARTSAAAQGEDPIKGGQGIMAAAGNDLGSPAPSRPDYSISPAWHAYAYERGGVRYVQINDADGVVRVVVSSAPGATLILPLGVDADHVSFGKSTGGQLVYRDSVIEVSAAGGWWYVHSATDK